ncbi:hypothetical protein DDT48_20130 [Mycobacteroides abscessus]|uniref:phage tail termination protein n=1 Tax=Mycobacteroides abscessus TaxID=36809 RepID=UPI000C262BC7|nr:hypothetical protein [Mycobacteroides abscessus]AWG51479.1 hypothetical protein DDT48_20130 [Mycobacteroides abscessus]
MSLVLPDWYRDNFVNLENLLIDVFSKALPGVECGCWTPDDWLDEQTPPDPMLWFFRVPGGRVDYQQNYDEGLVQVVAVSPSRDDSWSLMSVVRSVLLPMQGFKFTMADGFTAQIHSAEEAAGPQTLTPAQQIDTRVVSATFKVRVGLRSRERYLDKIRAL